MLGVNPVLRRANGSTVNLPCVMLGIEVLGWLVFGHKELTPYRFLVIFKRFRKNVPLRVC